MRRDLAVALLPGLEADVARRRSELDRLDDLADWLRYQIRHDRDGAPFLLTGLTAHEAAQMILGDSEGQAMSALDVAAAAARRGWTPSGRPGNRVQATTFRQVLRDGDAFTKVEEDRWRLATPQERSDRQRARRKRLGIRWPAGGEQLVPPAAHAVIVQRRGRLNLPQGELARLAGMSVEALDLLESGRCAMQTGTEQKLGAILGRLERRREEARSTPEALARRREALCLSQRGLARLAGLTREEVAQLEAGTLVLPSRAGCRVRRALAWLESLEGFEPPPG